MITTDTMVEESNVSIIEIVPPVVSTMPTRYHMDTMTEDRAKSLYREPHESVNLIHYDYRQNIDIATGFLQDIANHIKETLSTEIPYNWKQPMESVIKLSNLRHESYIPVMPSLRVLRLKLMYQIRRFPFNGLLVPVSNNKISEEERFCNHHPDCISTVPSRVFNHFMALTQDERENFFKPYTPPRCYIQRRLLLHPFRMEDDTSLLHSYDEWYWKLFIACSIEMECEVPWRHVVDMVHKAIYEVRKPNVFRQSAHMHSMYAAVKRNTLISQAPEWVWARYCQC